MFLWSRELLRGRSRFPETVENTENVIEGMEQLDGAVELAKQVLPCRCRNSRWLLREISVWKLVVGLPSVPRDLGRKPTFRSRQ